MRHTHNRAKKRTDIMAESRDRGQCHDRNEADHKAVLEKLGATLIAQELFQVYH